MRALAVLIASLLLIGCPGNRRGEDESKNGPPRTSTTTSNPQAVPERSKTMNPITPQPTEISSHVTPAASPEIPVQLTEYAIRIPDQLSAGPVTFHVANAGKVNHNFAVEGNGIDKKLASDLTPGNTAVMDFVLRQGTYRVYCPVDKHRGKGMERTVTVK